MRPYRIGRERIGREKIGRETRMKKIGRETTLFKDKIAFFFNNYQRLVVFFFIV